MSQELFYLVWPTRWFFLEKRDFFSHFFDVFWYFFVEKTRFFFALFCHFPLFLVLFFKSTYIKKGSVSVHIVSLFLWKKRDFFSPFFAIFGSLPLFSNVLLRSGRSFSDQFLSLFCHFLVIFWSFLVILSQFCTFFDHHFPVSGFFMRLQKVVSRKRDFFVEKTRFFFAFFDTFSTIFWHFFCRKNAIFFALFLTFSSHFWPYFWKVHILKRGRYWFICVIFSPLFFLLFYHFFITFLSLFNHFFLVILPFF